eukprot:16435770-Heterocapsa_arctica.AAC.1
MVEEQLGAENGIKQNTPEEDKAGGQTELTQDTGQKQEDIATQNYTDFQILDNERKGSRSKKINKRGTSDNEDEEYPG